MSKAPLQSILVLLLLAFIIVVDTFSLKNGGRSMEAFSPTFPMGPVPRILLLGDSLTQQSFARGGWGAEMANWFARRADVINRGLSGYNSRWIRHHLSALTQSVPPGGPLLLATVFLGANDCAGNHQSVPLDEFERNLQAIVRCLQEDLGVSRVVLMTPPPMAPEMHIAARNIRPEMETRSDASHALYGKAVSRVASALNVPLLDVRAGILRALGNEWRDALSDGLHLSPQGNLVVFNMLRELLQDQYPDIVPTDASAMLLPYHMDPVLHSLPPFPIVESEF